MDATMLARIQFGFTCAFHYLFPPLNIGLGVLLVFMEGMYLKTRNPLYHQMTRFWVRIFGLCFAVGVATGIMMEFQFGTNWAHYSRYVGDVFGSALAAEGIFAFFLESGFLAVLLFGWNKVKPMTHFISTIMVCLGAHFSAVWIIVANSWQQTPAGYHIVEHNGMQRAEIVDFWALVFNPSSIDRLSHVVMGCWQAGATLVISVSAFYLIRNKHQEFAKTSIKIALVLFAIASIGQLTTGHSSAVGVAEYQPAKLAAFEGHYDNSDEPASLYLFGWVNEKTETVTGVKIPAMLSFLVHGDFKTPVTGLSAFPPEDRPPVNIVFQTYHLMIAIGMALIGIALITILLLWTGRLWNNKLWLWILVFSVLLPQIANQVGWLSAEIGRQPWVVYGLMRTSEGVSDVVDFWEVLTSILMFGFLYLLLFVLFIYLLNNKIQHGPKEEDLEVPYKDGLIKEGPRA